MTIRLKFRHQEFQHRAAESVCDIFSGQTFGSMKNTYSLAGQQQVISEVLAMYGNNPVSLNDDELLAKIPGSIRLEERPLTCKGNCIIVWGNKK